MPPGFQKIRHYGWMNSNSKVRLDEVKWLVWLFLGWTFWLASGHAPQEPRAERPVLRCAECGGEMRVVDIYRRDGKKLAENWVFIDILHWLSMQGLDVLMRMRQLLGEEEF